MSLHLLKLCVGAEKVEDLIHRQATHWQGAPRHITRMWPKREAEVLAGGSIYWIFKGLVLARQRITAMEAVRGEDGIERCALILDPEVVRTQVQPRRAFQGWRYLDPKDAPADLPQGRAREEPLPPALARALADMGLR
ncbi:DUF1489 family protein [Falsirhodobacter halotolerans]|uniref:DUF1489 family protein n=1 Tax=Falsirhodobacter halotolerans TaxID=1146892 RepID=UPI001FD624FA|nr:DUF1489 domain-containing protein [Falsirhodobacter halotolerans]MCJ8138704.1 DUF1489 domain-containing protein [Falsirhodobacter halotolerans]